MEIFNERIIGLLQGHITGVLSPAEKDELELWCIQKEENRLFFEEIMKEELFQQEFLTYLNVDQQHAFILFEKRTGISRRKRPASVFSITLRKAIKYAAIILLPLSLFFLLKYLPETSPGTSPLQHDIQPGKPQAILTLNGNIQIMLHQDDKSEIQFPGTHPITRYHDQLVYDITDEDAPEISLANKLETPVGGEFKLRLSDGTYIHLNAASSLEYPEVFSGNERKVILSGEAWFEVAKNPDRPFIVEVEGVEIKVYGTSFNINAYRKNEVITALVEGKVGIKASGDQQETVFHSGQLAYWDKAKGKVEVKTGDVLYYTYWKEGIFRFREERLEDMLNTLARWYNVEIIYTHDEIKSYRFTGYMERYEKIETILDAITESTNVTFSIKDKTITVSK